MAVSDLYDVRAYVAYALPPNCQERAARAGAAIATHLNDRQRAALEFVLGLYARLGVEELDREQLPPLLRLKNNYAI